MRVRTTLSVPEDVWIAMRVEVEKRRLAGEKATLSGIIAKLLRAAIAGQVRKP